MPVLTFDQIVNLLSAIGQFGAAVFALIALVMSVRTSRAQTETSERLAREQAASNERLARDHQALLFEQVRSQRDSDILRWTEQVIDSLAETDSFIAEQAGRPFDDLAVARQRRLLSRLSALIDHGRMYFPNQAPDKQGVDKPVAYQGFRQRILSVLVFAYDALAQSHAIADVEKSRAQCEKLLDLRRMFVSEAQVAIDPRRFIALKEMNELRTERGLPQQTPQEMEWASGNGNRQGTSAPQQAAR